MPVLKNLSEAKKGEWYEFTARARKRGVGGRAGIVLNFGIVPSLPDLGEVPRLRLLDGQEYFALHPYELTSTLSSHNNKAIRQLKKHGDGKGQMMLAVAL